MLSLSLYMLVSIVRELIKISMSSKILMDLNWEYIQSIKYRQNYSYHLQISVWVIYALQLFTIFSNNKNKKGSNK